MKLLKVALERQNFNLAAHVLVYGLVKASIEEAKRNGKSNGKKEGRTTRQPERS